MEIIVDLEATCWKNPKEKRNEIIEIGAVSSNGTEFQRFIKPIENPILSDFCKELTHITQEDIDNAKTFNEVMSEFILWAGNCPKIYSWGNYDKTQFIKDCNLWNIDWEFRHLNLKVEFSKIYKIKRRGVKGALRYLDWKFEGTHHRGIDDARNIYRIYEHIKKDIGTHPELVRVENYE